MKWIPIKKIKIGDWTSYAVSGKKKLGDDGFFQISKELLTQLSRLSSSGEEISIDIWDEDEVKLKNLIS